MLAAGLPFVHRDPFASRLKAVAQRREELSARQRTALQERSARFQPRRHVKPQCVRSEPPQFAGSPRRPGAADQAGAGRLATQQRRRRLRLCPGCRPHRAWPDWRCFISRRRHLPAGPSKPSFAPASWPRVGLAYLPSLLLANAVQKRQKLLRRAFPDALDLMVICVESGPLGRGDLPAGNRRDRRKRSGACRGTGSDLGRIGFPWRSSPRL